MTAVCVAGATGWTGRAVCEGIRASTDLTLAAAVARSAAGQDLGAAWGDAPIGVMVTSDVGDALDGIDVLVDYTSHEAAKRHALVAAEHGVHVVMGTSGLTAADYADIDAAARQNGVGVVAAGNFSVTAAMAQAAAMLVAPYLPQREIIDYASSTKRDAPSGTARELAERLGGISATEIAVPVGDTAGHVDDGAPRSRGPRSTPCGCPALSSRPRSCSPCRTSGS